MNPIMVTSLAALTTTQVQPIIEWLLTIIGLNPPVAVSAGLAALTVSGIHSAGQWFQSRQSAGGMAAPTLGTTQPTNTGA